MSVRRAQRKFPQLDEDVKYFQVFYEAEHNDARTATYIALSAAEEGATVANCVEMIGLVADENGKAVGVKCRDNLSGREFEARAKAIIFAGGPFTDQLRKLESPDSKPAVAAAAGTHIVLPGYYCPANIGMLDINTSDGRFLFFLPWQGHTIVGTTDRKGPAVSTPEPPEEEIQWILREVEKYLSPDLRVRRADVLSAWQGFRPLASDPHAPPGAPVSRDHVISTNPETGVTFITGGKWTTYRHMAEDVVDRVVKLHGFDAGPCVTGKKPLRGGTGYTRNVPIQLVQEFGVSENTAVHCECDEATMSAVPSDVPCLRGTAFTHLCLFFDKQWPIRMACTLSTSAAWRNRRMNCGRGLATSCSKDSRTWSAKLLTRARMKWYALSRTCLLSGCASRS